MLLKLITDSNHSAVVPGLSAAHNVCCNNQCCLFSVHGRHIVALMRKAPESSLRAVYKKHCSSKFGEVAKVEVPLLPEATEV